MDYDNNSRYYRITTKYRIFEQKIDWSSNVLENVVSKLYDIIFHTEGLQLTDIQVTCYVASIPISNFELFYNNGLMLVNQENSIKLSSLFPENMAVDLMIKKLFIDQSNQSIDQQCLNNILNKRRASSGISMGAAVASRVINSPAGGIPTGPAVASRVIDSPAGGIPTGPTVSNQFVDSCCSKRIDPQSNSSFNSSFNLPMSINYHNAQTPIQKSIQKSTNLSLSAKPRHSTMYNKAKIAQETVHNAKKNKVSAKKLAIDKEVDTQKEKNLYFLQNKASDKMKIFESDKMSYVQMKKDLADGKLRTDDIHPFFVLKYDIFKVLDSRQTIDFSCGKNISNEYDIFMELYESYMDDNDDDQMTNVYVPHNYNYMTPEKKTEHAKKYKMTRQQFENKYVNCMVDDDIIENHIKNSCNGSSEPVNSEKGLITDINDNNLNIPQTNNLKKDKLCKTTDTSSDSSCDSSCDSSGDISDTDDDSSSDSLPKVDDRFLKLTQEYNKKN